VNCPKCRKPMKQIEKDTSSGRDMRTYECRSCKHTVDVDNGTALWKLLSDEKDEPA